MKQLTFEDTYTLGNIVDENALYTHFHYPEMLIRYDSNFINFKTLPSLSKFIEVENRLRNFHRIRGQEHVKFSFPTNMKLPEELITYLTDKSYEISILELYAIRPKQFPEVRNNPDIEIQEVTDESLEFLLELQYKHDLEIGTEFAEQKADLIKRQFRDQDLLQLLAFYKGSPAGYVDVIVSTETVEIDNLSVDEEYQKKGIGSRLQKFVMNSFSDKVILLVADGEDTPREMYKKQNYQYQGFKYEVLKVYED